MGGLVPKKCRRILKDPDITGIHVIYESQTKDESGVAINGCKSLEGVARSIPGFEVILMKVENIISSDLPPH